MKKFNREFLIFSDHYMKFSEMDQIHTIIISKQETNVDFSNKKWRCYISWMWYFKINLDKLKLDPTGIKIEPFPNGFSLIGWKDWNENMKIFEDQHQ